MRIAIFTPRPLDRSGAIADAARALADSLVDHGVETLLIGTGRDASRLTEGRLTIRALEQSGSGSLAPTGHGRRDICVGGTAMTWTTNAAIRRIIGTGELDLVVLVANEESAFNTIVEDAAPTVRRLAPLGAKGAAKSLIALAEEPVHAPSPLVRRDPIRADFHLHTEHSPDCSTSVSALVDRALALQLGALSVTDHDTVAGGYAARAYVESHGIPLHIAVSSEVKTRSGEVIGMYLHDDIPPGLSFADTVEAMREQNAFIYVPHPFDGFHAIAPPPLLERLAPLIDAFEIVNGRLARERFNEEAQVFAARLGLPAAAGSDAHVADGLFTAGLALPAFDDPASLALALGDAEVIRHPKSFLALQARKWLRPRRNTAHAE